MQRRIVRIGFAVALAWAALLPWLWTPPTQAAPLSATTWTFPGVCGATLQACISGAAPGDTVQIQSNTTIIANLQITKSLTLEGLGATPDAVRLSANNSGRVVVVNADSADAVILRNLTIQNGLIGAAGAGLRVNSGQVTLIDAAVISNTTTGANSGGGILAATPITLVNTLVAGNDTSAGGAGAGLRAGSSAHIVNSRFERNIALNPGGAMRVDGLLTLIDTVVISNSTTTITATEGFGGGIRADGGLDMVGGEVRANTAVHRGGGIHIGGGHSAVISGTQIISNTANDGGGISTTGPITLTNTRVEENVARTGDGGGLRAASAVVLIGSNRFGDNIAAGQGAAIFASSVQAVDGGNDEALLIFSANRATGHGGGIYASGQVHLLTRSSFSGNHAGVGFSTSGGAIYAGGNVRLVGGQSFSNRGQFGGAIHSGGDVLLDGHNMQNGNFAGGGGGCVFALGTVTFQHAGAVECQTLGRGGVVVAAEVRIQGDGTTLFRNSQANGGGGVAATDRLLVQSARFYTNTAIANGGVFSVTAAAVMVDNEFQGNVATGGGRGGVIAVAGPLTATNNIFVGNTATGGGSGGVIYSNGGALVLTDNLYQGNAALNHGGAILAEGDPPGEAVLTRERFIHNSVGTFATNSGGGAYILGRVRVIDSHFEGNVALFGGGLRTGDNAEIVNTVFVDNRAEGPFATGGGLFVDGEQATVAASSFISNSATSSAGGFWAESSATLTNTDFISNTAGATGGGLHINGGTGMVSGGRFLANHTGPDFVDGNEQGGGGLYNSTGPLTLTGVTFTGNTSEGLGGAVVAKAAITATGNIFLSNQALGNGGEGGAVYVRNGPLTLRDNRYEGNQAGQRGGAIFYAGEEFGDASLLRERFLGNSATASAGAIFARESALEIAHSVFDDNAAGSAGAISLDYLLGLRLHNSLFMRNRNTTCCELGVDVSFFDGPAHFVNNTFADPQSPANQPVAIHVTNGTVGVTNTIFSNYTASIRPGLGAIVHHTAHNLYFNAPPGAGIAPGPNSLTVDPRFVNPANRDYRLQPSSPAIDAGLDSAVPAGVTVDLAGQPRFHDGPPVSANLVDMGAFESQKVAPTANAGGPYTALEGAAIALSAQGSSADTSGATFAWDCTNDGVVDQTVNTATGASCTYADNGAFTVRLLLTDGDGFTATATAGVTIANVAPVLSGPAAQAATVGQSKAFDLGSFADPGPDAPWQVVVDWGDGTPTTTFSRNATGSLGEQTHQFTTAGDKTITVTVTDKDGGAGTATATVTVTEVDAEPQAGHRLYLPQVGK